MTKDELEEAGQVYLVPQITENQERAIRLRVTTLSKRADISFKMLAKSLPDARPDPNDGNKDGVSAFMQAMKQAMGN